MTDAIWTDSAAAFAKEVDSFDLDLDPQVAQAKKAQRGTHYNVVVAPIIRVVGFAILAVSLNLSGFVAARSGPNT